MKKQLIKALRICVPGLLLVLCFSACVYKLDIQQGNVLDRDKVAQLKVGMTKRQVRYLLGTPMIIDTFNQERWDYFYSLRDYSPHDSEGTFHQERLTLVFEKGQLSKIDNQLGADVAAPVSNPDQEKVTVPEPEESNQGTTSN